MTVIHHELPLPNLGEMLGMKIPVVRHLNMFYIHILPSSDDTSNIQLEKLNKTMTSFYDMYKCTNRKPFKPGDVVATKYHDGNWY